MTIGQKLFLGFLAAVILVGLMGYVGATSSKRVGKAFQQAQQIEIPSLVATLEIKGSARQASIKAIEYSLRGDKRDKNKAIEALQKLGIHIDVFEKTEKQEAATHEQHLEESEAVREIKDSAILFKREVIQYISSKDQGVSLENLFAKEQGLHKARRRLVHALYRQIDFEKEELAQALEKTQRDITNGTRTISLLCLASLFLAILIGLFTTGSISKPARQLIDAAREIGEGKLEARVNIGSSDEIGQLARTFNKMGEDLRRYRDHLERLVKERTAELGKAIEYLQKEVAERRQAEEALREQRNLFETILAATPDLLVLKDRDSVYQAVNPAFCRFIGKNEKEIIGKTDFDLFPHTEAETYRRDDARVMKSQTPQAQDEQVTGAKGNTWLHVAKTPVLDETGTSVGILCSVRDVTERKLAAQELAAERERLEVTLRSIADGVIATDAEGRITLVNRVAENLTGWGHEAAIGKPLGDVFHIIKEMTREPCQNPVDQAIKGGVTIGFAKPTILVSKDGTERILAHSAAPILNIDGKIVGVVIVFRDVTKQRKIEARLQDVQKVEAIATLAGGIAHEFNNALVGISGNIELLQMGLPDDDTTDKYFRQIKDSTRRVANLTHQLLAYARGGKYQPKIVSLTDFVEDTLPLIKHSIAPAVRVETDLPGSICHAEIDVTQMQMVLSAVLNNSAEAMEGHGRVRIITRDENIDEEFARTNPDLKPGPYICLTIEDEGKGMDEETRSRIFDPFFTTKFQGRGLGMAAVYGIIINHGGWISVDSELGKGTVVRMYLPAVASAQARRAGLPAVEVQVKQAREAKTEVTTGAETILVIEDEDVVIDVIRPMLERIGYRTLLAKTGKEAVDIANSFDGDIDLAILDIVLPDMGGKHVYPRIMEARPNLKVIVCSGYTTDGPAQDIIDAGAQGFIQKPFSLERLQETLKEVLEGQTAN